MTVQKNQQSPNSSLSTPSQVETNGIEKSSKSKSPKEKSPTNRSRVKLPVRSNDAAPETQDGMEGDTEAKIAARAYEMYEERMRLGQSLQDWLRAEQEILAMRHHED